MSGQNAVGTLKAKLSAFYRLGSFVVPDETRVGYVGPGRSTNLGDQCMIQAYSKLLPDLRFSTVPLGESGSRLARLDKLSNGRTLAAIALGGGTLIGSARYRQQLETLGPHFGGVPMFMLGVGVEDPNHVAGRQPTDLDELTRWSGVLERFDRVRVRGPRSQEILREIGVESEVVGDSALILGDIEPRSDYSKNLLGLNIGISDPVWGGDVQSVWESVVRAARVLTSKGWRIRLLPVWPRDLAYTRSAADAIGPRAEVRTHFGDVKSYLDSIRECDVFVGEKLHSVVLASAVFVPSIMLEYRPKCLDFQLSLGRGEYNIRIDKLEAADLVDRLEQLSRNRPQEQSKLSTAVAELRGRLRTASDEVIQTLRDG